MENTETAGGSRFSAGKPVPVWVPMAGLGFVREAWHVMPDLEPSTADHYLGEAWETLCAYITTPTGCLFEGDDGPGLPIMALVAGRLLRVTAMMQDGVHPSAKEVHFQRIPVYGLDEVCRISQAGAEKYAPLDWEVGQSFSTLLSSAWRHLRSAVSMGAASRDEESGFLHVAHALWNILCLLHFIAVGRGQELDDVTRWRGITAAQKQAAVGKTVVFQDGGGVH